MKDVRRLLRGSLAVAGLWSTATLAAGSMTLLPPVLAQGTAVVAAQGAMRLLPPRPGPADATLTQAALQSPVLAGACIDNVMRQALVNAAGVRRDVLLIWEADPMAAGGVRP